MKLPLENTTQQARGMKLFPSLSNNIVSWLLARPGTEKMHILKVWMKI